MTMKQESKYITKKKNGKYNIAWISMFVVSTIYLFLYFANHELFVKAINKFLELLIMIYPYLILVFAFMFITFLFLKPDVIKKHLGKESGIKGCLLTSAAGIISVGPAYVWYPLIADMQKKGMRNKLVTVFIYNRAIKIHLLPLMFLYFGIKFSIVITLLIFIFSFVIGEIVEKFTSGSAIVGRNNNE